MKGILFWMLALAPAWNPIFSQETFPIKVGVFAEQICLPTFEDYGSRKGCGITLGTSLTYTLKDKSALLQTIDLQYWQHKEYGSAFMLSSLFDYSIRPGKWHFDVKAGPGMMLFSHYTPVYTPGEGGYEKASQGQVKWAGILSLSCSYPVGNLRPYIAYTAFAESPFIQSNSAILPHQLLELGVSFTLSSKSSRHE